MQHPYFGFVLRIILVNGNMLPSQEKNREANERGELKKEKSIKNNNMVCYKKPYNTAKNRVGYS